MSIYCEKCGDPIEDNKYITDVEKAVHRHLLCDSKDWDIDFVRYVLQSKYKHGHPSFLPITLSELDLHDRKNHDYAKGGSPLGNFERVANFIKMYPGYPADQPVGIALIYMMKQLDAIFWGLSQKIEHKVESLDERFADVHIYAKIARCCWREMKSANNKT
jgi:hypothetical protein